MTSNGEQIPRINPNASGADELDETRAFVPEADDSGPLTPMQATWWAATQTQSVTSAELPPVFGRYNIVRELGGGGMGQVYLAHDGQLERLVALKIPKFRPDEAAGIIERFYREARAMAALRHQNLCTVYDVGEIDGVHFLTMEYIDGRPLSGVIKATRPLASRAIAALIRRLALALQEAHQAGVVHRDLKPANIIIDRHSQPIVVDFGLAWRGEANDENSDETGMIVGTPAYMSPEQFAGRLEAIGPASDTYSLGVILYELLAGRLPFLGPLRSVMVQIVRDKPPRPSELRDKVASKLESICLKAMAKEPGSRFASLQQMADELAQYLKATAAGAAATVHVPRDVHDDRQRLRPAELVVLCPVCATRVDISTTDDAGPATCPHCSTPIMLHPTGHDVNESSALAAADGDYYHLAEPTERLQPASAEAIISARLDAVETNVDAAPEEPSTSRRDEPGNSLLEPWSGIALIRFLSQSVPAAALQIEFSLRWFITCTMSVFMTMILVYLIGDVHESGVSITSCALLVVMPVTIALALMLSHSCLIVFEAYATDEPAAEIQSGAEVWDLVTTSRFVLIPLVVSLAPGGIVSYLLAFATHAPWVHQAVLGCSCLLLFPLFFLSVMRSESAGSLLSSATTRSLRTEARQWRWLYGVSLFLFVTTVLLQSLASHNPPLLGPFFLAAVLVSPIVYFQLLGRLYYRLC